MKEKLNDWPTQKQGLKRCIGQDYKVGGRLLAKLDYFLPPLPAYPPCLPPGKKAALMWDPTICMGPPPPQQIVFNQQFEGVVE